jgi:integrase
LAERYLSERAVSRLYSHSLRRLARNLGELSAPSCNRYLKQRLEVVSSVTVSYERAMLMVLWNYAVDRGLVKSIPRGIVKIKAHRPPTRAWTLEQCCTAVKGTFSLDEKRLRSGCPVGLFLRCWLLLGYESGARRGDLWRMTAGNFSGDTLWWTQHKTGDPLPKLLSQPCVDAVKQMLSLSTDRTVLAWAITASGGNKVMFAYLKSLNIGGSSKWLRRSSATHIEMLHPGKGRLHLGHRTMGLAERAYIDWTQVRRDIPQPPQLIE